MKGNWVNCNACGVVLAEGTKFCGSCGTQVGGGNGTAAQPVGAAGASDSDKFLVIIAHLGGIFFGFIPSLIVYLIRKDQPGPVLDNAREALNWQITALIGYIVSMVLSIILIGLFLFWIIILCNLVLCIIATVKSSPQKAYRYPMTIRLVK